MTTFEYTARVDPSRIQAGTIEVGVDRSIAASITQDDNHRKKKLKNCKNLLNALPGFLIKIVEGRDCWPE